MKRIIEFRGLRVDNNQWVYGSIYITSEYIYIKQDFDPSWLLVKPETVGQFTSVIAKGETKLFEGDIFHVGDPYITYEVVWHDSGFKGKQIGVCSSYIGLEHWAKHITFIGNINEK